MSKMFIANLTHQVQDFQYRLPENPRAFKQPIPVGGQIQISGDLSTPDISAIIQQHAKYGMVAVSEIDRTRSFAGVCYSLDKPVNVDAIRRGIISNHGVLVEAGKQIRKEAAVAVNNQIEERLDGQPGGLHSLEMTIEELESDGSRRSGVSQSDHDKVSEGIRVDRGAPPGETKGPRSRASRRQA